MNSICPRYETFRLVGNIRLRSRNLNSNTIHAPKILPKFVNIYKILTQTYFKLIKYLLAKHDDALTYDHSLLVLTSCNGSKHCFYSISEAIFDVLYLPEIQGRKCWGSPFSWLVTYAPNFNSSV
ncbi:putative F-box protein [Gossypium australe]|uniref:Putative F-box protein n=1 Tax=Gossypium australe TaxID=47621 RepID=A0A5B6WKT1_9ROSI|nr:putative F-box protein [Gossypium australe]